MFSSPATSERCLLTRLATYKVMKLFSCLKDKVTPGMTMFFQSEIKRWQCVCWLSILWAFKSTWCKRQQSFKKQLCPQITRNQLRPTLKRLETLCLALSCDHFVFSSGLLYLWIFIRKKCGLWRLKKTVMIRTQASDNLSRKIFSLFFSRSLSLSVYYFSIYC